MPWPFSNMLVHCWRRHLNTIRTWLPSKTRIHCWRWHLNAIRTINPKRQPQQQCRLPAALPLRLQLAPVITVRPARLFLLRHLRRRPHPLLFFNLRVRIPRFRNIRKINSNSQRVENDGTTVHRGQSMAARSGIVIRELLLFSPLSWSIHLMFHRSSSVSNSELRRQIHIQSEQKRRAQIKDGFEDLRNELPSCLNKKMSKVALLHKSNYISVLPHSKSVIFIILLIAVQHIQHLKNTQMTILAELERLVQENEQLRKYVTPNVSQKLDPLILGCLGFKRASCENRHWRKCTTRCEMVHPLYVHPVCIFLEMTLFSHNPLSPLCICVPYMHRIYSVLKRKSIQRVLHAFSRSLQLAERCACQ